MTAKECVATWPGEGCGVIRDKQEHGNPIGTVDLTEDRKFGVASECEVASASIDDKKAMRELTQAESDLRKRSTVNMTESTIEKGTECKLNQFRD